MPRVVVCDSAREAAIFCHEQDRLNPRRQLIPRKQPNLLQRNARGRNGVQQGHRNGNKKSHRNGHKGQSRGLPHSVERPRRQIVQAEKNERKNRTRSRGVTRPVPLAPTYEDKLLMGDSIMVRLSRHIGLYAPKEMPLCKGGITLKQLIRAVEDSSGNFKASVVVMVGVNNVLQEKAADESLYKYLVDKLKEKGVETIYFMTLPPMGDGKDVGPVNEVIKGLESPEQNIRIVDMYGPFMKDNVRDEDLFENKREPDSKVGFDVAFVMIILVHRYYHDKRPDLVHPNAQGLTLIRKVLDDFILNQMVE